jgi:hypothetical protein
MKIHDRENNRMRIKHVMLCFAAVAVFLLSACASSDSGKSTIQYPPTDQVAPIFQINQAPASCRVFAHLFATMPANMTTSEFTARISEEAKASGADMMLIGQSRQCTTESSLNFSYYGPDREYAINEWPGWSFGFNEWGKQGNWASIGYDEWLRSDVHYDYPIVLQVVFLRCRQ